MGPRGGLDGRNISSPPGFDHRLSSPSSVAISTELPGPRITNNHHHHHVLEGLGMLACSLILQMKLVPPSLPRSSYVSSSVWFVF